MIKRKTMRSSHPNLVPYLSNDDRSLKEKWQDFLSNITKFTKFEINFILLHTDIGKWWRGELSIDKSVIKLSEVILIFKQNLLLGAFNKDVAQALWYASAELRAYYIYGLEESGALTQEKFLSNFEIIVESGNRKIIQDCVMSPYLQNVPGLEKITSLNKQNKGLLHFHINYEKIMPLNVYADFCSLFLLPIKTSLEQMSTEDKYKYNLINTLKLSKAGVLWQGGCIKVGDNKSYKWKNLSSYTYVKIFFDAIKLKHNNIAISVTVEALWKTSPYLRQQLKYGKWCENSQDQLLFFRYLLYTKSSLIINSVWKHNIVLKQNINRLNLYQASKVLEAVLSLFQQADCHSFILDYLRGLRENGQDLALAKVKNKIINKIRTLNYLINDLDITSERADLENTVSQLTKKLDLIKQVMPETQNTIFLYRLEYKVSRFFKAAASNQPSLAAETIEHEAAIEQDTWVPVAMEEEDKCLYSIHRTTF